MGSICSCVVEPSRRDLENHEVGCNHRRLEHTRQSPGNVVMAHPPIQGRHQHYESELSTSGPGGTVRFTRDQLARATESFNQNNQVGSGFFGEVYMAEIGNQKVAIKRLIKKASDERDQEQFMEEVKALQRVDHPNLVKLIGYCCEGTNRLIVCEYCPNLSLRVHLHETKFLLPGGETMVIAPLPWGTRMQIATGSAKGLAYLHEVYPMIIHRDIKPDNIVLDADFKAKVADFGLAKIFPNSGSKTHLSSDLKGTAAYADREHGDNQKLSDKSDVYSFGVVLLELISGREPEIGGVTITDWAKPLIKKVVSGEGEIEELIDPKLKDEMRSHKREMEIVLFCAAASVYKPAKKRPTTRKIVEALEMKIPPDDIWNMNSDHVYLDEPTLDEPTLYHRLLNATTSIVNRQFGFTSLTLFSDLEC